MTNPTPSSAQEPNLFWNFMEKNLGMGPGECRVKTPFDGEIARIAYSSICLPGEDEEGPGILGKLREQNKKQLYSLVGARNEHLKTLSGVSASCLISHKELSDFTSKN